MAKKQNIANGTKGKFLEYDDGEEGALKKGVEITVTGYDPEQDTYNVEDGDGNTDSLYVEEFEVVEDKKATTKKAASKKATTKKATTKKAATKKTAKTKAAKADEEETEADADEEEQEEVEEQEEAEKPATKKATTKRTSRASNNDNDEEEIPLPKFKKTTSVGKALKAHDNDPLTAAEVLSEEKERTVFTLGGILAFIKRNDSFLDIVGDDDESLYEEGLKGFNAYVEAELDLKPRTANYYVQLYERFSQITTESKIAKIGWTKLRELLPLSESALNDETVDEWLELAKDSSSAALKEKVRESIVNSGDDTHGNQRTAKQKSYKLVVHEDQAEVVDEALAAAREVLGDDASDSACFVHILGEWMNLSYEEGEE